MIWPSPTLALSLLVVPTALGLIAFEIIVFALRRLGQREQEERELLRLTQHTYTPPCWPD